MLTLEENQRGKGEKGEEKREGTERKAGTLFCSADCGEEGFSYECAFIWSQKKLYCNVKLTLGSGK